MKPFVFALPLLALVSPAQTAAPTQEQKDFFENRIRPVLAQRCYACHSSSKMGGLQVDSLEGLLKGGKSGPAIVPGHPEDSRLILAIGQSTELKMPKNGRLSDGQIADFTAWIKGGATSPVSTEKVSDNYVIRKDQREFWSFQPLAKPAVPTPKTTGWALNDIDRFVMAKLEKEDLKPAPQASKRDLIRRVSYDLTGLPPTMDEVTAFEQDKSPDAYEKLVDKLLGSPHYGETWGRHWLDVVRFGESDYRVGEKKNHEERYPYAYVYRDWVIHALNDDIPYDTWVKAQLAGDLMDEKVRDKMVGGLGMNGLGVWQFNDNPIEVERAEEWQDKVDVTSKALLGLTVGCARCHNHKYDPIPQKDYYRLASVFASSSYHGYPLVSKEVVDEYESKKKVLDEKEKTIKDFQQQLTELTGRVLFSQTEKYIVAAWKLGSTKKATVAEIAEQEKVDPEILDRWVKFLKKRPVNYSYLKGWQAMVQQGGSLEEAKKLAHEFYMAAVDVDKQHTKLKEENEKQQAKMKDGAEEVFDIMPNGLKRRANGHQVDLKAMAREAIYLYKDLFENDLPEAPINSNAEGQMGPGLLEITDYALQRRLSPEFAAFIETSKAEAEVLRKAVPKAYPLAPGLTDNKEPTDLKILVRGNPYDLGEPAPRGFLTVFSDGEPTTFEQGSGRMELAEDILKEPISIRVIVNRIWKWNMGVGIVETPNNFGFAGDRPSNPELLDYLASKFIADGMSWKKLTKEIVMSRTYQLSATPIAENIAKDADNRFYWRASRRRLEAEGIWDSLLTVSGKLDLAKIGGPSEELDTKMTRRGLYGRTSRVFPTDFQVLFDAPTPTLSAEKRYTTNVALQRLFFLNNDFVRKQAIGFAARVKDAGGPEAQIRKAFEIAYQRAPSAAELQAALTLFDGADAGAEVMPPRAASLAAKPAPAEPEAKAPEVKGPRNRQSKSEAPEVIPKGETPIEAICWALLSSNEFLLELEATMSCNHKPRPLTRRQALAQVGGGFGLMALSGMLNSSMAQAAPADNAGIPGVLEKLHFKPRAKRVIFLFMNGGVSHVDTFDPKPTLDKYDGQPFPGGTVITQRKTGNLMKSPFKFSRYGKADTEMSDLWPNVGAVSEELCVVRSMYADIPNHEPSITLMNTGANVIGRPSMGSWITYGLGIENRNLPGYVVLVPSQPITIGSPLWSSAFLPAIYQGTYIKNEWIEDEPFKAARYVPNVTNSAVDAAIQRRDVNFLRKLNEMNLAKAGEMDSQLDASIKTMETAFQMQTEAPDVFDVTKESKAVLDMYGPGSTALGCLMAVRLAEKGVRMVQVYYSKGDPWDAHNDIMSYRRLAKDSDQPFAAVVKDLKQRGMLEDTLVIGGTEFGRTPAIETANSNVASGVVNGRDHNHYGFSIWLAGGGIKGGMTYGATDDFGYKAIDKPVHVHDLHATILYLLGIDHTKLTYKYSGRDFRLTDTAGEVIHDIIA